MKTNTKTIIIVLSTLAIGLLLGWLFFGGKGNNAQEENLVETQGVGEETIWTCSMHPQIRQNEPGDCPICGMDLIPNHEAHAKSQEKWGGAVTHDVDDLAEQVPVLDRDRQEARILDTACQQKNHESDGWPERRVARGAPQEPTDVERSLLRVIHCCLLGSHRSPLKRWSRGSGSGRARRPGRASRSSRGRA